MSPTRDAHPERGAILILTLILMSATVFLGLSYLSASTFHLETQDIALHRLRAQAIAEGAIEIAHQQLIDSGSRGSATDQTLGNGIFSFETTSSTGGFDIVATAQVEGVSVRCHSRVESLVSELELNSTLIVGGKIVGSVNGGDDFYWAGMEEAAAATAAPEGGKTAEAVAAEKADLSSAFSSEAPDITFDRNAFDYDTLSSGGIDVSDGTVSGNVLCEGNMSLTGNCVLEGSVYIQGDLTLDGLGTGGMKLLTSGSSVLVFVEGDLDISDLSSLDIQGSLFVLGNANVGDIDRLNMEGSLVVNGNLDVSLDSTQGMWLYDEAIATDPSPVIQGGDRSRDLTEAWRRFGTDE